MSVSAPSTREVPLLAVVTFVLWTVTCSVAAVGVLIPYVRPKAVERKEMIVTAETLQVELTSQPIAIDPEEVASTAQPEPPDLDTLVRPMEEPSFTAVADPKLVQFAMPVEGPVHLVEVKAAAFAAPAEAVKTNAPAQIIPAPQQLIYGRGDGLQPEPEYPYRAKREGQEGVVKGRAEQWGGRPRRRGIPRTPRTWSRGTWAP